jgi:hypothetical protein
MIAAYPLHIKYYFNQASVRTPPQPPDPPTGTPRFLDPSPGDAIGAPAKGHEPGEPGD